MQDVVFDFLCHSRRVHDKFYRVEHGKHGLVRAFEILQSIQMNPVERCVSSYPSNSTPIPTLFLSNTSCLFHTHGPFSDHGDLSHSLIPMNSFDEVNTRENSKISRSCHSSLPASIVMKECSINVIRESLHLLQSINAEPSPLEETTLLIAHHKSIFHIFRDKQIFKKSLYKFIERVNYINPFLNEM